MNEGRRTQVVLLDERRLDIVVQPRLETQELQAIVASHCRLKDPDKQFFALAYFDEKAKCHWLQAERRVLDHEFPRKFTLPGATLVLFHMIKFFVESVVQLCHPSSVELFFLQAKHFLARGYLVLSQADIIELSAYLCQICYGDLPLEDYESRSKLSQILSLPKALLKRSSPDPQSSESIEERVLAFYRELSGISRGVALLKYMALIEASPTYGMHFYDVNDKAGVSWTLGINSKGIFQFEKKDHSKPRRVFQWKQLENLYYRDKKFSLEIHDPRRVVHTLNSFNLYEDAIQETGERNLDALSAAVADPSTQVSVSRRSFAPSSVQVHVFFCETSQECKTIWSFSIAQHQFYLDRKTSLKRNVNKTQMGTELAAKLTSSLESTSSLEAAFVSPSKSLGPSSDLGSSISSQSLPSLQSTNSDKSEEEKMKDRELYNQMKAKKAALEKALLLKLKELKENCIREGELTGELPKEIQRTLAPGEEEPKIKRRVGTGFAIPNDVVDRKFNKSDQVGRLEMDVEIQRKIVSAALRLSSDKSSNKSVRRKRQKDYENSLTRLKQLEQKLHQLRLSSSKPDLTHVSSANGAWPNFYGMAQSAPGNSRYAKSCPTTPKGSLPDLMASEEIAMSMKRPVDLSMMPPLDLDRPPLPGESRGSQSSLGSKPPPHPTAAKPKHGSGRGLLPESASYSGSLPNSPQHHAQQLKQEEGSSSSRRSSTSLSSSPVKSIGSVSSLPIYENVGYRTSSSYQSSYRKKQYPTLNNENGSSLQLDVPLGPYHRTHSEHSLQSLPNSEIDTVQPLPDYRTFGGEAVDHDVGAYNVPHQRTSWNYESMEQGLNRMESSNSLQGNPDDAWPKGGKTSSHSNLPPAGPPKYGFASPNPFLARKLSSGASLGRDIQENGGDNLHARPNGVQATPMGTKTSYCTGSLDRRFLRSRNRLRQQQKLQSQGGEGSGDSTVLHQLPPPPPSFNSSETLGKIFENFQAPSSLQYPPNSYRRNSDQRERLHGIQMENKSNFDSSQNGLVFSTPSQYPLTTQQLSVRTNSSPGSNSVEISKPLETNDVLKYSNRSLNGVNSPNKTHTVRPMSPLVNGSGASSYYTPDASPHTHDSGSAMLRGTSNSSLTSPAPRPPPPPYGSPRRGLPPNSYVTPAASKSNGYSPAMTTPESLAWYDDKEQKQKTATIV